MIIGYSIILKLDGNYFSAWLKSNILPFFDKRQNQDNSRSKINAFNQNRTKEIEFISPYILDILRYVKIFWKWLRLSIRNRYSCLFIAKIQMMTLITKKNSTECCDRFLIQIYTPKNIIMLLIILWTNIYLI